MGERITKKDIENKFRELQDEASNVSKPVKAAGASIAAGGGMGLAALAYLFGGRKAKKKSKKATFVEVRKI